MLLQSRTLMQASMSILQEDNKAEEQVTTTQQTPISATAEEPLMKSKKVVKRKRTDIFSYDDELFDDKR